MPPKAYPQVAKARFYKVSNPQNPTPPSDNTQIFTVHFNPESLQYDMTNALESKTENHRAVQYVTQSTAKLSLECVYDTTNEGSDVRNYTKKILGLMAPDPQGSGRNNGTARKKPAIVKFEWGAFSFMGYIESYKEVLDFFSHNGVPLRSKLNLVLAQSDASFTPDTGGVSLSMSAVAFTPPAGATISNLTQQGGGAPDDTGRETAEENGVEDPKNPPTDEELVVDGGDAGDEDSGGSANDLAAPEGFDGAEVSGGAGVAAAAGAGFGASAGASAGFGASAGASFGASAGVSAGFGASAGASFGASAGASFGASAGASFGASAGASAGFGASAGAGASFGASAGASAGFGASAGAGASFGASAGASAGFGASAGASAGFGASAGAGASFGASAGSSFGASTSSSFGSVSSYTSSYASSYTATASASGVATIVSGSGRSTFTSNSARWNLEAGLRTRYEGLRFERKSSVRRVSGERLLSSLSAEQGLPITPDTFLPGGQALHTEGGIRAEVDAPLVLRSAIRFEEG